jgi:ribosomal subunit interface protein
MQRLTSTSDHSVEDAMSRMNHLHVPNHDLAIHFQGRNVVVPDHVRDYARERLERSSKFGLIINRVEVELLLERNPRLADESHRVEITGYSTGEVIRAEASGADWLATFDECLSRLHERLRRHGERRAARRRGRFGHVASEDQRPAIQQLSQPATHVVTEVDDEHIEKIGQFLVRDKTHRTQPMSVAQALDSLELIGHEFFAFIEQGSDDFCVIYKRKAFTYGLIRLQLRT